MFLIKLAVTGVAAGAAFSFSINDIVYPYNFIVTAITATVTYYIFGKVFKK